MSAYHRIHNSCQIMSNYFQEISIPVQILNSIVYFKMNKSLPWIELTFCTAFVSSSFKCLTLPRYSKDSLLFSKNKQIFKCSFQINISTTETIMHVVRKKRLIYFSEISMSLVVVFKHNHFNLKYSKVYLNII